MPIIKGSFYFRTNEIIVQIADCTDVKIDRTTYSIIAFSNASEIMNDIHVQVIEDQGRKLQLF